MDQCTGLPAALKNRHLDSKQEYCLAFGLRPVRNQSQLLIWIASKLCAGSIEYLSYKNDFHENSVQRDVGRQL